MTEGGISFDTGLRPALSQHVVLPSRSRSIKGQPSSRDIEAGLNCFPPETIAANRALFPKPLDRYAALTLYGPNIVASEDEQWKRYRKVSAPSFSEVSSIFYCSFPIDTRLFPAQ